MKPIFFPFTKRTNVFELSGHHRWSSQCVAHLWGLVFNLIHFEGGGHCPLRVGLPHFRHGERRPGCRGRTFAGTWHYSGKIRKCLIWEIQKKYSKIPQDLLHTFNFLGWFWGHFYTVECRKPDWSSFWTVRLRPVSKNYWPPLSEIQT